MIINEQGTFYVEGDYAQGDTILTAGDWELRANGSKNAFGYSPETFVRRNLLNWSEDFTKAVWRKEGIGTGSTPIVTANAAIAPDGSMTADRAVFNLNGGSASGDMSWLSFNNFTTDDLSNRALSIYVKSADSNTYQIYFGTNAGGTTSIKINVTTEWQRFVVLQTPGATFANFNIGLRNLSGATGLSDTADVLIWGAQLEQAATPSDYQRTTTHVPRPFAIKDELVTNGTFDTDTSGWDVTRTAPSTFYTFVGWDNGQFRASTQGGLNGDSVASQLIPTVPGLTYQVTADVTSSPVRDVGLRINNVNYVTTDSSLSLTFVATSSTTELSLRVSPLGTDTSFTWDNVSVKEVQQPLTLGNGNHKDFRYYPKKLSQNEVLELVK